MVRYAVAANPSTPADVLEWLADQRDGANYQFARAVAYNPSIPETLFALVIERLAPWEIIRNPRLGPERQAACTWRLFAEHLIRGWDPVCLIAALLAHPQCPPKHMDEALESPHWIHRYAVTQNPGAPAPLLELLAGDANQLVRFAARKVSAARQPDPGVAPLGAAQPRGAEP